MRHDRNEGDLAHIGRFTRHIGARNEHQAVFVGIEMRIVGHKIGVLNELLNNGMATVLNDDLVVLCNFGANVLVLTCHNRKGAISIQLCKKCRGFLNSYTLFCHKSAYLLEQFIFQSYGAILGT